MITHGASVFRGVSQKKGGSGAAVVYSTLRWRGGSSYIGKGKSKYSRTNWDIARLFALEESLTGQGL